VRQPAIRVLDIAKWGAMDSRLGVDRDDAQFLRACAPKSKAYKMKQIVRYSFVFNTMPRGVDPVRLQKLGRGCKSPGFFSKFFKCFHFCGSRTVCPAGGIAMNREVPALVKNNPSARPAQPTTTDTGGSTSNWSFFDTTESYLVSPTRLLDNHIKSNDRILIFVFKITMEMLARIGYEPRFRTNFFYIGIQNRLNGVTSVKFSFYEGRKLWQFLKKVLAEINSHPSQGRDYDSPIPMFASNPERGKEVLNNDTRTEFFNQADLLLTSIRVRVVFNDIIGQYEMIVNSPVNSDISRRLKGWIGPCLYFNIGAMQNLDAFLQKYLGIEVRREPEAGKRSYDEVDKE